MEGVLAYCRSHMADASRYRRSHMADDFVKQVDDVMEIEKSLNSNMLKIQVLNQTRSKNLKEVVTVQGSTRDGCSLARMFYPKASTYEAEMDIFYNGGSFPVDMEDHFHALPDNPAHVKIDYHDSYLEMLHPKIRKFVSQQNSGCNSTGYINSRDVKIATKELAQFKDHKENLNTILAILFQARLNDVIIDSSDEVKQAAATTTLSITFLSDNTDINVSIDHVPGVQVSFWPSQAGDWFARNANWPGREVKEKIMSEGCHVVPKPRSTGDQNLEWRYSFSNAESYLMQAMSANQKRSYFLFKAIFYKYIKPIEGTSVSGETKEVLFSYLAKTIMLYACEEKLQDDQIWARENIIDSVKFLVKKMEHSFKEKKIAHYFIPSVNLLEGVAECSPDTLLQAAGQLENIAQDMEGYLEGFDFNEVKRRSSILAEKTKIFNRIADVLGDGTIKTMEKIFKLFK